jgi:hypothetical protein
MLHAQLVWYVPIMLDLAPSLLLLLVDFFNVKI